MFNLAVDLQVMDYGYPQFTEAKILSEFIKTDAYRMEVCLVCTEKQYIAMKVNSRLVLKAGGLVFAPERFSAAAFAGASATAYGCDKCCVLEKRRHQIQEE